MNRKQRRAALKQSPPAGGPPGASPGDPADLLLAEAVRFQQQNKLNDAVRAYKRLLLLKPDHAQANNNLGIVLLAQGKAHEASARFAQALTLMPQLLEQYQGVCATLAAVLPPLGDAVRKTMAAWPQRLPADQWRDRAGLAAMAADPLLLCLLQSIPVRDVVLERTLTSLRAALLAAAGENVDHGVLGFCCALAKQCFINEYAFATTPEEDAEVGRLKAALADALGSETDIPPLRLAALAMYEPLHALRGAQALLAGSWPAPLTDLLTQQVAEPSEERALRATIPRLTAIDDDVSLRVQQQYEANPYPRWVHVAGQIVPTTISRYLDEMFPTAVVLPQTEPGALAVLVAGCGTGWHAIEFTQKFDGIQVLAVDLSLSSLSYARRKTPAALAGRIAYAQADILKLGALGRSFNVIDASGVLHHMADPVQGWRSLVSLLRPRGLMHLGFYSEVGRRDLVAARSFIAERGYGSTPAEIRRCRQDLLDSPLRSVARFSDFFSTSECRDMLFHVQEGRLTIPVIKSFLAENSLRFLGFEFDAASLQKYRALFASSGWSMTDLDRWHALETSHPDTFSSMYQFWVQKN
jgi:SAM-dependent methyltransferase/tetratricopeptide (TPR) repeat protein